MQTTQTTQTPDYSVPDYLQQLRLDRKNFVVLGAGQGIGEATSHALAQAGARVLCVDREEELALRIAKAAMPAEVAGPILFLASNLSAHMTGQIVVVDGGSTNLTPFPKVFGAPKKS